MTKRVYKQTVIKFLIGIGSVGTLIGGIFLYLYLIGAIDILGYSGDMICAGTELDPCYAYINFTPNEDIFIYPTDYDPWGRNATFAFDPAVSSWRLQRSWGTNWRNVPLDRSCTGTWCGLSNSKDTRKFSVAFREGRTYQIRIVAYKRNPTDIIKWSAFDGLVDPYWLAPPPNATVNKTYEYNETDEWVYEPENKTWIIKPKDPYRGGGGESLEPEEELIKEKEIRKDNCTSISRDVKSERYIITEIVPKYVNENCTTKDEAKSIMYSQFASSYPLIIKLDKEGKYPIEMKDILDFNATSITLNPKVSNSELNKDIPIEVYSKEMVFDEKTQNYIENKTTYYLDTVNLESVDEKIDLTLPFGFDKVVKLGENSTELILDALSNAGSVRDSSPDVACDAGSSIFTSSIIVGETGSNFNYEGLLSFDTSSINPISTIDSSILNMKTLGGSFTNGQHNENVYSIADYGELDTSDYTPTLGTNNGVLIDTNNWIDETWYQIAIATSDVNKTGNTSFIIIPDICIGNHQSFVQWHTYSSGGNEPFLNTTYSEPQPPTTPVVTQPVDGKNYTNTGIEFTSTDPNGDDINFTIYINGTLNITNAKFNVSDWNASDGIWSLTVSAWDGGLSSANSSPILFRLDTVDPVLTLFQVNDSPRINVDVNWSINLSDDASGLDTYRFAHNASGSFVNGSVIDAGGALSIRSASTVVTNTLTGGNNWCGRYWTNDSAGNSDETANGCVTIENTPPITPVLTSPIDGRNYTNVDINYTSSDADGDAISYSVYINNTLNSSSPLNISNWVADDGYYNLTVTANDSSDVSANSSVIHFRLDTIDPSFSCDRNNSANIFINSHINFTCTFTDNGSGLNAYIFSDNGTTSGVWVNRSSVSMLGNNVLNVSEVVINSVSKGEVFSVIWYINDSAGNTRTILISNTVLNAPPDIPVVSFPVDGITYSDIPYINYSASDRDGDVVTFNLYINGSLNHTSTSNLTDWNATDGTYNLTVDSNDGSRPSLGNSTSIVFTLDSSPPAITNYRNTSTTNESSFIEWDCSKQCNYTIILYTNNIKTAIFDILINTTLQSSHNPYWGNLSNSTTYWINLTVKDSLGNTGSNNTFNFTTTPNLDLITPGYSNLQNNATSSTLVNGVVNWSIDLSDGKGLSFYVFANNDSGTLINVSNGTLSGNSAFVNKTITITETQYGTVCGQFWFNDSSNNINQTSLTDSGACFQVSNEIPTVPTILVPYNNEINNTRTIKFTSTDEDSLTYNIYINGSFNITTSTNITTWNGSDGTYNLTMTATDGFNTSANSSGVIFVMDTTAPVVTITYPTNFLNISSNSIDLNASAVESVATSLTYYWMINGTTNTTTVDTNSSLNADDGFYNLTVFVSDGLQNGSDTNFFTLDTTSPIISSLTNTSTDNDSSVIQWTTNEDTNYTLLWYNSTALVGSTSATTFATSYNPTISNLLNLTTYFINLTAYDRVGNLAVNNTFNFTTTQTSPPVPDETSVLSSDNINLGFNSTNFLVIIKNITGGDVTFDIGSISSDLTFIAFSYDGTNLTTYLNGVQTSIGRLNATIDLDNLFLGKNQLNNKFFNGAIDEISIYNRNLNSSEINDLYLYSNRIPVSNSSFTPLLNLEANTTRRINCTLNLINISQTYVNWSLTESNAEWSFNYTINVTNY